MTVYVVGLDGASIGNMSHAIEKYGLANLRKLFSGGDVRPMTSVYPYVTAPAWTTLFSGVNPGRHGVFDMLEPTSDGSVKPSNMRKADVPFLWDYLSWAGKSTLVAGVPFIYPAPEVNGAFVTGRFTPALSVYPPGLAGELDLSSFEHTELGSDEMLEERLLTGSEELAKAQVAHARKKFAADLKLTDSRHWDAVILVQDLPDEVFHLAFGHGGVTRDMFAALDGFLGEVMRRMTGDDLLFVVSDHGFGPVKGLFYVNEWLTAMEYVPWKRNPLATALHALGFDWDIFDRPGVARSALKILHDHFPWALRLASRVALGGVLGSRGGPPAARRVSASSFNEGYAWIRVREETPEQTEATVGRLYRELSDLKRRGALKNVFLTSEIYRGPHAQSAPGQLMIETPDGWTVDARRMNWGKVVGKPLVTKKGAHRREGIFIRYPDRRDGKGERVRILDVAPTILAAMRVPSPGSFEGRAIP